MRRISIVTVIGVTAAVVTTTSVSAQMQQKGAGSTVAPPPGATMAPPAPGRSTGPTRPTTLPGRYEQLTEGECTQLGGRVIDTSDGVCNSGQACFTVDENKNKHAVCITAKK